MTATPALTEHSLLCVDRVEETHDTATFFFDNQAAGITDYKPGQFTSVKVDIDGKWHYRAYTISSTPSRPDALALTVKRVTDGLVSNHLLDSLEPGMRVTATAPTGEFNLTDAAKSHKYLFVSAGCGITPVMSMARYLLDTQNDAEIRFVHCARTLKDFIFGDELKQLNAEYDNFHLELVLTRELNPAYHQGPMSEALLQKLTPTLDDFTVFTCGPEAFMAMLGEHLETRGFDMSRFHQESFGQAQALTANAEQQANGTSADQVTVHVPGFGKSIDVDPDTPLFDALEDLELPVIKACGAGVCGACRCKVTKGEVESTSQVGLTPADIEAGVVLSCATTIKGNVEVEIG